MKKIYLTTMLIAFMAIVANATVTEKTISYVFKDHFSATGTIGSGNIITDTLTFASARGGSSNAPAYNATDNTARFYYVSSGNGGYFTTTAVPSNVKITGMKLYAYSATYTPTVNYNLDGGVDNTATLNTTDNTYSITGVSATDLKFRNANTTNIQLRLTQIDITYSVDDNTSGVNSANSQSVKISATEGKVVVEADQNVKNILIYNTLGQLVKSVTATTGTNQISVPAGQLYIVKAGATIGKVLTK